MVFDGFGVDYRYSEFYIVQCSRNKCWDTTAHKIAVANINTIFEKDRR
jgi:hypothetical protein